LDCRPLPLYCQTLIQLTEVDGAIVKFVDLKAFEFLWNAGFRTSSTLSILLLCPEGLKQPVLKTWRLDLLFCVGAKIVNGRHRPWGRAATLGNSGADGFPTAFVLFELPTVRVLGLRQQGRVSLRGPGVGGKVGPDEYPQSDSSGLILKAAHVCMEKQFVLR